MSDVLKGLCARRADLERRIAAAQGWPSRDVDLASAGDVDDRLADLHFQLRSINNQISVYSHDPVSSAPSFEAVKSVL